MENEETGKTILLVDDDEGFLLIVTEFTKQYGYNVVSAIDGEQGLKKFKEVRPDLISTGIRMPVMDGVELIKKIRKIDGEVPIIVVTGMGYILKDEALASGANAVFLKPFIPDEFMGVISDLLEKT